jgi:hypothetical protein
MTDTATLITQLRVLAHLTRTEAQVAHLRVTQARTDDVRRELTQNGDAADARVRRIVAALRDLGALPDPVGPVLGRVTALLRGAVEQTQPLDEALLGDLALEHQLRERARYARVLADAVGLPAITALADDLVVAHTATVDWLAGVLADVAGGRPAALKASPLQRVAGQVARAVNAPGRRPAEEVDGEPTPVTDPEPPAADAHRTPIPGLADMTGQAAIAALRTVDDLGDVAAVLAFERANANRLGVVAAAHAREEALGGDSGHVTST